MKNYTKISCENRQEWLSHRRLGSSDASAIMGTSKWRTKGDIYDTIVLNKQSDNSSSERMIEGTIAEEHIRKLWELEHKEYKVIYEPNWLFVSTENDYLTLSPDALLEKNGILGGLEIKDVELRKKIDIDLWHNGIPEYYFNQLIHYFIVLNDCEFMILNARLKYMVGSELDKIEERSYYIARKDCEEIIAKQRDAEERFIDTYLKKKKRPSVEFKL